MKLLFFIFIVLSQIGFSQNFLNGSINNSINGKPIEFANIYNIDRKLGTYSKLDGSFKLKYYNHSDKVVISCVGYEPLNLNIDSLIKLNKIEIKLEPIIIELNQFVVSSEISYSDIGFHKRKHNANHSSRILGIEYATLIKDDKNSGKFIEQIILSKVKKSKGKIRIHLYDVDKNGLPHKDLIPNNLIIDTKEYNKKKEIVIDVSKHYIPLNMKGVFIGIEWVESVNKKEKILARFHLTKKNETITYTKYNLKEKKWREVTTNNMGIGSLNLCVGLKIRN